MKAFVIGTVFGVWLATVLTLIGVAVWQHGGSFVGPAVAVGTIGGIVVAMLISFNAVDLETWR